MIPGEIITAPGEITLNAGAKTVTLTVSNTTTDGVLTASHATAARNFRGWVSASSGTISSASLTVEG